MVTSYLLVVALSQLCPAHFQGEALDRHPASRVLSWVVLGACSVGMGYLVLTPNGTLLLKFADTVTTQHSVFTCPTADIKAELEYSALHVMEKCVPLKYRGLIME